MKNLLGLLLLLSPAVFAAGTYDGIYQYGLSPAYYSVHQNGNQMIVASMGFTSINSDVVFRFGSYEVTPASIGTWDYASGTITGNKARISGISLFGSCVATTDITFETSGNVTATLVSYANTAFGTSEGVNCAALYRDAVAAIGGTITLRRIF
jgi:hypothetical protein